MGIRSFLSKPFAAYIEKQTQKWAGKPIETQHEVFDHLIKEAKDTTFGEDHDFSNIHTYEDFKARVPIRGYEQIKPYIEKILDGESDVLWKGRPIYFSKTSGTTSGVKYIPITKASMPNHTTSARNALLAYVHETGNSKFLDGKMMFLSGSPELDTKGGIHYGRLSGIVNHHIPGYLRGNQMPSYETNCIDDWEHKLDTIIDETLPERMTLISGIPPWVQMYFDKIIERTGKSIKDVFPDFSVFVHGGVNFEPYKSRLFESIGKEIDAVETYPASEGFVAYQNRQADPGLLLLLNSGIFFEFIPADEYFNENPARLSIGEVKKGVNYAIIINSNAGLWGYSLGDTVMFTSLFPHKLVVTGRMKHFISAFGEHVIASEVEKALQYAVSKYPETDVTEFTIAPSINPDRGKSRHEWFIEFSAKPSDMDGFATAIDQELIRLNPYYDDLISGNILQKTRIVSLKTAAFREYMKSLGKLGGQNKVPRLSNDRNIADQLLEYQEEA